MSNIELLKTTSKEVVEMKINGKSFFGKSIVINQSTIVIDGVTVSQNMPQIKVEIMGSCEAISTMSGDVYVADTAGPISTQSGDVECRNVLGSVTTMSGGVECGVVSGSVSTMSGDVSYQREGV